jgi:hypothetical protein
MCFRQREPCAAGSPHSVHRLSRRIRSWYFRCRETFSFVNSSLIGLLISSRFWVLLLLVNSTTASALPLKKLI